MKLAQHLITDFISLDEIQDKQLHYNTSLNKNILNLQYIMVLTMLL